jgi:hypothetical protein
VSSVTSQRLGLLRPVPDFTAIHTRIEELHAVRLSRQYENQKHRDWQKLLQFLADCTPPADISTCTPEHVVQYLIWRDQFGRTIVHSFGCQYWGSQSSECLACPRQAAWGSVDSLIGRLRASFHEQGGRPADNPFASRMVHNYLRDVQFEQVRSRVQPSQAVPMFEDKFCSLILYINTLLRSPTINSTADQYVLFRDRAFLALDLHA